MEFEGIVQQIILLPIDRDYYILCPFKRLSSLQTWLFTVVRRLLARQIQRQGREMSLEDLPMASLSAQPEQEDADRRRGSETVVGGCQQADR